METTNNTTNAVKFHSLKKGDNFEKTVLAFENISKAENGFVTCFIHAVQDYQTILVSPAENWTADQVKNFYGQFRQLEDSNLQKKFSQKLRTSFSRFKTYKELKGVDPVATLPQAGYGELKEYPKTKAQITEKENTVVLPEDAILELFEGLTKDLQKEVLKKLQTLVKSAKAK